MIKSDGRESRVTKTSDGDSHKRKSIALLLCTRHTKIVQMTVQSESMRPTLDPGDHISVRIGKYQPAVGDVVLFYRNIEVVVHRIIRRFRRCEEIYLTKGDSNLLPDLPPVTPDEIIGQVVQCMPMTSIFKSPAFLRGYVSRIVAIYSWLEAVIALYGQRKLRRVPRLASTLNWVVTRILMIMRRCFRCFIGSCAKFQHV
jgi:signal peptidase I